MQTGHIIALGGGGFSMEDDPSLDQYVLSQARGSRPAVSFIGTASGDADSYLAKFYAAFARLDCLPSHLPLFRRTPDLASHLREQDVVYVGGGNTRTMLAAWREWGLPELLREAWERGTVLAGISAGAICWFDEGVTDASAGPLGPLSCLGFLPGSCCPHYDGEADRRPAYHALIESRAISPGVAIDDGAAVHFIGRTPHRIVASRAGATAHQVSCGSRGAVESPLPVERVEVNPA
jgi:peptidase E